MDKDQILNYWLQSAEEDAKVAKDLFLAKHYTWSLFMWQLAIEKQLKAL